MMGLIIQVGSFNHKLSNYDQPGEFLGERKRGLKGSPSDVRRNRGLCVGGKGGAGVRVSGADVT